MIKATSQYPALMAARACATCMTKEDPPTDVLSVKLGVIPRYSAVAKEEKPAVNTPFTSDLDRPASSRAFDAASAWCCKDDLFGTVRFHQIQRLQL